MRYYDQEKCYEHVKPKLIEKIAINTSVKKVS